MTENPYSWSAWYKRVQDMTPKEREALRDKLRTDYESALKKYKDGDKP